MTNSLHDMGGMHGFGRVEPEPDEPPFHQRWEGRVLALQRAMGFTGLWTIDAGRASLEALPPLDYLGSSYYRRWFLGLEQRLLRRGLIGEDELAAGRSVRAGPAIPRTLTSGRYRQDLDPRRIRPPDQHAGAVQGRRTGTHPETSTP